MTEHDYLGELEGGDMLERVASRVHDAWWDEKKAQGFHPPLACSYAKPRPAIGSEEAEEAAFTKHCEWCHTDMYPYSTLPEHVKEYDRATVRAVFSAMSGEGWLPPEDAGELRRKAGLHEWWCSGCSESVPSEEVTFCENHDERKGGCGKACVPVEDVAQQEKDDDE